MYLKWLYGGTGVFGGPESGKSNVKVIVKRIHLCYIFCVKWIFTVFFVDLSDSDTFKASYWCLLKELCTFTSFQKIFFIKKVIGACALVGGDYFYWFVFKTNSIMSTISTRPTKTKADKITKIAGY
jgi:hypothetical protein